MTINLARYQQLKKTADEAQREADRQAGVLVELKKQLKKDFGVGSIGEARALLKKLRKEEAKAETEYEEALDAFTEKYPDLEEQD